MLIISIQLGIFGLLFKHFMSQLFDFFQKCVLPVTGQPVPGRAPVAPPAGVPNPVNRYKFTQQMRNPPQAGVQPNMVMSQVIHIFERNQTIGS
jgi:hypothetical protein